METGKQALGQMVKAQISPVEQRETGYLVVNCGKITDEHLPLDCNLQAADSPFTLRSLATIFTSTKLICSLARQLRADFSARICSSKGSYPSNELIASIGWSALEHAPPR